MDLGILPSEILDKRAAILKALLGPAWLGPAWRDGLSAASAGQSWASMERCYGRLVGSLLPGLGYLRQLGQGVSGRTGEGVVLGSVLALRDVPVALIHAMRVGMIISPSGITTCCRVSAGDLLRGIVPLLAWMYCLNDKRLEMAHDVRTPDKRPLERTIVLLSAMSGAGKSVVASLIEQFANLLQGYPQVQSIGMDGWHLPNRVIQARMFTDESGQVVPLATRKGSPESFDVKALAREVESLARDSSPAQLPVYDRTSHEPAANAVTVGSPIVLLEGNYLLLQGQGWEDVAKMACGTVWLDVPVELARRSIVERHVACGRTREEAEARWRGNDWPNAAAALRGRPHADAVIYLDGARRICFVHRTQGLRG